MTPHVAGVRTKRRRRGYRVAAMVATGAACLVLAGAGFVWIGHRSWVAFLPQVTPSCSWPLQVSGKATSAQAGLVRCYLQALAKRDSTGLSALAVKYQGVHITKDDLIHSSDSRAGPATATFRPNPSDSTDVAVTIRYADGAMEQTGLTNMIAFGGHSAWRMDIGTGL